MQQKKVQNNNRLKHHFVLILKKITKNDKRANSNLNINESVNPNQPPINPNIIYTIPIYI